MSLHSNNGRKLNVADLEGTITEIRDDTFWGQFEDGTTFDMPNDILNGHAVGDVILRVEHETAEDKEFGERSFILIGETYATIICTSTHEDGEQIDQVIQVDKKDL